MRPDRERSRFVHTSPDWQLPQHAVPLTGVLITRLEKGVYGVFMQGRWRRHTMVTWQTAFVTTIPAGLMVGSWALLPKIVDRYLAYVDHFSVDRLQEALDRAKDSLNGQLRIGQPTVKAGLNKGDRATVLV